MKSLPLSSQEFRLWLELWNEAQDLVCPSAELDLERAGRNKDFEWDELKKYTLAIAAADRRDAVFMLAGINKLLEAIPIRERVVPSFFTVPVQIASSS